MVSGYTDPGNVDAGDTIDPTWGDNVRADLNLFNGILAKGYRLNVDATKTEVTNTATQTNVFTYTIPGNTLGTGNIIVARTYWRLENTGGSGYDFTFYGKYGTDELSMGGFSAAPGTSRNVLTEFHLIADGATGAQIMFGRLLEKYNNVNDAYDDTYNQDSTGDLDFDIDFQWSGAQTYLSALHLYTTLELIQV